MRAGDVRLVRDLLNDRSGLTFADDNLGLLERRLRERMGALGLGDLADYLRLLGPGAEGDAELAELYELVATKETYLFREDYQLRAFRDSVLPVLAREGAKRKRLTCWSAGCSTGEEAYSVAVVLLESGLLGGWDVRVIGTDLSRRRLATARAGVYGQAAFRATSADRRRQFFVEREDGVHVCGALRRMCQFGLLNLVDMGRAPKIQHVDAIFCRNVIIYLDSRSRRQVVLGLHDRLREGGYLMLGHAESLIHDPCGFELVRVGRDLLYRKPAQGERSRALASRPPPSRTLPSGPLPSRPPPSRRRHP
jgi:chemotaxis protein methyltransferase CheR